MPTPKKGPRLGSGPAHQRLMLSTLAKQLFVHEGITTTEAKARQLRPYAERLITKAKNGDLTSRREVNIQVHHISFELKEMVLIGRGPLAAACPLQPRSS